MPKEISHIVIAQHVLAQLKESGADLLARIIEQNLPAFYLGAIIPDAFFYDVTPLLKSSKTNVRISRVLHSKKTANNDEKAVGLFDAISANPSAWRSKTAFAAGIVTHTVSDRIIHGVIDYYTTTWGQRSGVAMATHRQIETLVDMALLLPLKLHPREFQFDRLVNVHHSTRDVLFRLYLCHLIGARRPQALFLQRALTRAHAQQLVLLRLFGVKALYHIMTLSNRLSGDRLAILSSLFYPEALGTDAFPIMDRLNLNALTDGRSFTGTLASLVDQVTMDAIYHIRVGLRKLGQGEQ